jgi:hypothetical protein
MPVIYRKVQEFFDGQAILFNVYRLDDCAWKKSKVKYSAVLTPHEKMWKKLSQIYAVRSELREIVIIWQSASQKRPLLFSAADPWHVGTDPDANPDPRIRTYD